MATNVVSLKKTLHRDNRDGTTDYNVPMIFKDYNGKTTIYPKRIIHRINTTPSEKKYRKSLPQLDIDQIQPPIPIDKINMMHKVFTEKYRSIEKADRCIESKPFCYQVLKRAQKLIESKSDCDKELGFNKEANNGVSHKHDKVFCRRRSLQERPSFLLSPPTPFVSGHTNFGSDNPREFFPPNDNNQIPDESSNPPMVSNPITEEKPSFDSSEKARLTQLFDISMLNPVARPQKDDNCSHLIGGAPRKKVKIMLKKDESKPIITKGKALDFFSQSPSSGDGLIPRNIKKIK